MAMTVRSEWAMSAGSSGAMVQPYGVPRPPHLASARGTRLAPAAVGDHGAGGGRLTALAAFAGTAVWSLGSSFGSHSERRTGPGGPSSGCVCWAFSAAVSRPPSFSEDREITGSRLEEHGAAALGLALPFSGALGFMTLLMALQVTDPVVPPYGSRLMGIPRAPAARQRCRLRYQPAVTNAAGTRTRPRRRSASQLPRPPTRCPRRSPR